MEELVTQAAKFLEKGEVVSLPTETVYSLSANACNDSAVERIYQLKGRRKDNPLALLVGSIEAAEKMVYFNKYAQILAEAFFPGSLTLILQRKPDTGISALVNEGLATLAVRMPNHKMTLDVLNSVTFPVIGTSANPSGLNPATNADEVQKYFGNNLGMILDGGAAISGVASTIIDLSGDMPKILRHGTLSTAEIEEKLGMLIEEK